MRKAEDSTCSARMTLPSSMECTMGTNFYLKWKALLKALRLKQNSAGRLHVPEIPGVGSSVSLDALYLRGSKYSPNIPVSVP